MAHARPSTGVTRGCRSRSRMRRSPVEMGPVIAMAVVLLLAVGCSMADRSDTVPNHAVAVVAENGAVELLGVDRVTPVATVGEAAQRVSDVLFTTSGVVQLLHDGEIRWIGFETEPGGGSLVAGEQPVFIAGPARQVWQIASLGDAVAFLDSDWRLAYSPEPRSGFKTLFWEEPDGAGIVGLAGVEVEEDHVLAIARGDGSVVLVDPDGPDPKAAQNQTVIQRASDAMIRRIDGGDSRLTLTYADGSIESHDVPSSGRTQLWPPSSGEFRNGASAVDLGFAAVVRDVSGRIHVVRHDAAGAISADVLIGDDQEPLMVASLRATGESPGEIMAILTNGAVVSLDVSPDGQPVVVSKVGPISGADRIRAADVISIG